MRKFFAIIIFGAALMQVPAKADDPFTISSPDFKNGDILSRDNEFSGFGCSQVLQGPYDLCTSSGNRFEGLNCHGKNIAPTIRWNNPPAKTRSFALTVYDPDMPTGGGWWHFVVYNIPRNVRDVTNGKIPQGGVTITNDSGTKYYMGPCPPAGSPAHRYIFTIYALDSTLDLPSTTSPGLAAYMINRHKLASSSIYATYARP